MGSPLVARSANGRPHLNTPGETLPSPDPLLSHALATVVEDCLAVRAGESVLVVADTPSRALGEQMREQAEVAGADAVLALMAERAVHGAEPPPPVAAALG
ncbi:MAG: hypothetical protein M3155_02425, partial [Actinomycetota bacterium]|nr:hypothetical protein [Actinomycetota bacterium]